MRETAPFEVASNICRPYRFLFFECSTSDWWVTSSAPGYIAFAFFLVSSDASFVTTTCVTMKTGVGATTATSGFPFFPLCVGPFPFCVGPFPFCVEDLANVSPRRRMPFDSILKGSQRASMTWRAISARPYRRRPEDANYLCFPVRPFYFQNFPLLFGSHDYLPTPLEDVRLQPLPRV